MKINEITQSEDDRLFEAIDKDNDTGFLTEDLISIIKTEQAAQWSRPMTADELLDEMDSWES